MDMQQGLRPHHPSVDPLHVAEVQYKLALRLAAASAIASDDEGGELDRGSTEADRSALSLTTAELEQARAVVEMSAVRIVAIAADTALQRAFPGRFTSANAPAAVVRASLIACVLRNAFAHDLLLPRWQLHDPRHVGRFEIPDVIVVDTTAKDGRVVRREDLGGPLALVGFLRHIGSLITAGMDDDDSASRKAMEIRRRGG